MTKDILLKATALVHSFEVEFNTWLHLNAIAQDSVTNQLRISMRDTEGALTINLNLSPETLDQWSKDD